MRQFDKNTVQTSGGITEEEERKKKVFRQKVLKGAGFLFLFLVIVGVISNFSSPSRYALSDVSYEGFDKIELAEGVYIGNIADNLFSGEGQFCFLDGVVYAGEWKKSKMNGDGSCSYPGVGIYKGEYTGALRNGNGTFTWDNGDTCTGKWVEDAMVEGTYTFANGSAYEGTFSEGKADNGIFSYAIPKEDTAILEYTVTFQNGQAVSIIYKLSNGFSYEGSLLDNGNANITYEDGDTYSGEVKNGLREGSGIYFWKKEGELIAKYDGKWQKNDMNGQGIYYYTNEDYPSLNGVFEKGLPNGSCIYTKEEGNTFTVTFENGTCINVE